MEDRLAFWISVAVRVVLAMVIPLHFSYSQGFLDIRLGVYGMTWVYSGGLVVSAVSVVAALMFSSPLVACEVFARLHSGFGYPTRLGVNVAALLILLPVLGIPHPTAQDPRWQGSPYLFPSGFYMMLLLLFVVLPAIHRLFDSQHMSAEARCKILAGVMLGVCLFMPIAVEDHYGLLGFSEQTIYWCLGRLSLGRWGLTNEVTFELTDSVGWSGLLLPYPMLILLLMARLMLAALFTGYVAGRVPLRGVAIGAVAQEAFILCAVLISGTRAIATPNTVWTLLPLPFVLPVSLILVWAWLRLKPRIKTGEIDEREYVNIPITARIRSLFMRKRRK